MTDEKLTPFIWRQQARHLIAESQLYEALRLLRPCSKTARAWTKRCTNPVASPPSGGKKN